MAARTKYSDEFKANIVKRVCTPGGPSAYALARELGISKTALYDWVERARRSGDMNKSQKPRRPQDWSPAEKLKAVIETADLREEELGRYLRSRGVHLEHLQGWREQAEGALGTRVALAQERALKRENKRLSRELQRKDAALAEAAALLVLSKKVRALWGAEGENT